MKQLINILVLFIVGYLVIKLFLVAAGLLLSIFLVVLIVSQPSQLIDNEDD